MALSETASVFRAALSGAAEGLVEREILVELVGLAAVAREHLLVIGPPGTAKSHAVRRVAAALGGVYFEYLLGRFTEPSEIFGPVDLRKLKEGIIETETSGMLPEAEVAFLDEVFLGSTAILNSLLEILNERTFRRGRARISCPLRVCVGASNALPSDESLAAFADRFLVRVFLEPVPDPNMEDLLLGGWKLFAEADRPKISLSELDGLAREVPAVDLGQVRSELAHALRRLRKEGVVLSDRRAVKTQRLVAAAAVLAGRTVASPADLWPLVYAVPTSEHQEIAKEVLRPLLTSSENAALSAAAAEASRGLLARAARLEEAGAALYAKAPAERDESFLLRLEGLAREIDAGFPAHSLPAALASLRLRIVSDLEEETGPRSVG